MRTRRRQRAAPGDRLVDEAAFHLWLETALRAPRGALRMGDDVASLSVGRVPLLLTTDALSEGSHFLPESPPIAIGGAAIAASLSDIAAKGGRPIAAMLDLLLPPGTPDRWARDVVLGAEATARRFGLRVVGGDTKPCGGRAVVGTVVGRASCLPLPGDDRARAGDRVVVTGTVGSGGAKARPLLEGRRLGPRELLELLRIEPRLREGEHLAPLVRAMVDTSDGLAAAARRIARASGVAIVVDEALLPVDPGLADAYGSPTDCRLLLYGGDYELVATLPQRRVARAIRSVRSVGGRLTVIGRVEPGRGAFLVKGSVRRAMPREGWDPFGSRPAVRRSHVGATPR